MKRSRLLLIVFLLPLMSCSVNPYYDAGKKHHTKTGFKNIYYEEDHGLLDFLKWRWEKTGKDIPGTEDYAFPVVTTHHELLKTNREKTTLTWIGHATFLIQVNGINILTDPQFSNRASPVSWAGPQRVVKPGLSIDELPEIDFIIYSHDHYDSLDVATLEALSKHNRQRPVHYIVPLGFKTWFEEQDIDTTHVVEFDWSDSKQFAAVRITAEPIQHWCKRTLFDTNERLWAAWVIEVANKKIYFAGDTGYAPHFKKTGEKYGSFDLALIPIGAYEPRWFMKSYHVNPDEAVQIHKDLNAKYSVAMHWGTFILTDEPLDEPPVKLAEALKKYKVDPKIFEVYKHGETRILD